MRKWVDQWGVSHEKQPRSVFPSISNVMNEMIEEMNEDKNLKQLTFSSPIEESGKKRRKLFTFVRTYVHPLGPEIATRSEQLFPCG